MSLRRMRSIGVCLTCVLVLTLLVPVGLAAAQSGPVQTAPRVTDELLAEFAALVESELATYHIPGAALAVVQDGEILLAEGFGVRNLAEGAPFTAQTQFRIGSTTKSMTSFLIARLVDEGRLAWDTPVTDLLPEFRTADPELTERLTLRDLMGMDTGLVSNDLDGLLWGDWSVDDLLAAVAGMAIGGELGEFYSYNNEVYASAAYAAVAATGADLSLEAYKALMQDYVFDAIGMPSAVITDDPADLGADYALGYDLTLAADDLDHPAESGFAQIGVVAPAGAVWVSVEDMARYLITQLEGGVNPEGTRLVSEEVLAETWQMQVPMDLEGVLDNGGYAMGWIPGEYQGVPVRFHDGGWTGYLTNMLLLPEANAGVVIFANHAFGGTFTWSLTFAFAELLYGLEPQALDLGHEALAGMAGPLEAQLPFMPDPAIDPEGVADWLGEYENGWTLAIRDENQLWLARPDRAFLLLPLPDGTFLAANGDAAGALIGFAAEGDQTVLTLTAGEVVMQLNKVG